MIVVALIVVVLFGLAYFQTTSNRKTPPAVNRQPQSPPPTPAHQTQTTPPTPKPFDQKSSHATPEEIIRGPAYVVDGDTIVISKTQIRLFGVDAPEMNHPYGKKAKWALVSLCKGQTVEAHITAKDNFDRTVAKCFLSDGRDLSAEMVKLGLAIDWPKFSGGKYRHLEIPNIRKKLWLADARQKGRMHVWEKFEKAQAAKNTQPQR